MKFNSETGLIPAIIQDHQTMKVLMLGYMSKEAFEVTLKSGKVTFFSRSKQRLWTKGETSGNYLTLIDWSLDCDKDTLLIKAKPAGPVCHKGSDTCWGESNTEEGFGFLNRLEDIINQRYHSRSEESYTSRLFTLGINKIAQKVGEEAVELVIEAKDANDELFIAEAADLLYHLLILLRSREKRLQNVIQELQRRHSS